MVIGKVLVEGIGVREDIDTSYNERKHLHIKGIVKALPDNIGEMAMLHVEGYGVKNQIEVGDEVMIQWYGVSEGIPFEDCTLVDYSTIICIVKDRLIPVNGYVLHAEGKVVAVSSDLEYFRTIDGESIKPDYPEVGDFIWTKFSTQLEHFFYQEQKEKIYVTHLALVGATWHI